MDTTALPSPTAYQYAVATKDGLKGNLVFNDSETSLDLSLEESQPATPVNWDPTDYTSITAAAKRLEYQLSNIPDDLILHKPYNDFLSGIGTPTSVASTAVEGINIPQSISVPTEVRAQVRARIPYPEGEFNLYLFKNNQDAKEHLAIVFGDDILSLSLEEPRPLETEMDRKIR